MTAFRKVPFLRRIFTLSLVLSFVVVGLDAPGKRAAAQGRGTAQLRSAVAANSDGELQKVESAFAGTQEAAQARLLRGYMRIQAKDYATAASILNDPNIARQTSLGD